MNFITLIAENPQEMQPTAPGWSSFVPILVMAPVMIWLFISTGRKQKKEAQQLFASLKKNDKILTNFGVVGWIVSIKENDDEVVIKTGDQDSRLTIIKSSINRIILPQPPATT